MSLLWHRLAPCFAFVIALLGLSVSTAQAATVVARVDISSQRMQVYVDGKRKYTWRISSGKKGWETKPGSYTPFKMQEKFYSKKWRMSLPYLIWIGYDGTAVHGTTYHSRLGRPASHGCIRLSISNARKFYRLVQRYGMWGTRVDVQR